MEGAVVSVSVVQGGGDFLPNPPQAVNQCVGQLAPGTYTVRFRSEGYLFYETQVEVGAADCSQTGAEIPPNISEGRLEVLDAETILIDNVRIPCFEDTYWGSFRWNPHTYGWALEAAGANETASD